MKAPAMRVTHPRLSIPDEMSPRVRLPALVTLAKHMVRRQGMDEMNVVAHDDSDGLTTAAAASVVDGGSIVYVDPPKTVIIPLGASVITGPRDVITVKVDPSAAVSTKEI